MASPVSRLMREGGVVALGVAERAHLRHLHDVAVGAVKRPVAAVLHGGLGAGEETLGGFKPRDVVVERRHRRMKMGGQAVDLLGVKNRIDAVMAPA